MSVAVSGGVCPCGIFQLFFVLFCQAVDVLFSPLRHVFFYIGKVLTSLAFLSEITGSDKIFDDVRRDCLSASFVRPSPAILVFVITGF